MKCNIARDLIPLYNESLCEEETARELEQHLAKCRDCKALTTKFEAAPETSERDINPFKKIGKKLIISRVLTAILALIIIALIVTVGSLIYGELNKSSGYMSFSRIFMDIELKKIGGLLEKGDIDGFAEYVYIGGDYSDILLNRLKTAYNEELSWQKCRVTGVTDGTMRIGDEVWLESRMTLEFEEAGELTLCLVESETSKYHMYVISERVEPFELTTVQTLDFIYNYKLLSERADEIDKNPRYIVPYFNNGRTDIADMAAKLEEFTADGSEIVTVFVSVPLYDEGRDEFYSKCMIRLRDSGGNEAVVELRAIMGTVPFLNVDTSTIELINQGMSEEKIEQALNIILTDN
ncbi:MAG: zf-HC2 domain-containing protein [Oscillospiraceae bacterium]|nr:zf-HC2 domain-containing protein [Oscillospiraceae bacterium]